MDFMESQHNGTRKDFSKKLCDTSYLSKKLINDILPFIPTMFRGKGTEDYKIDGLWVKKDCPFEDVRNVTQKYIRAAIEHEITRKSSWPSYSFRHPTGTCLSKKDKYVNLQYDAFFLRINNDQTNAYIHPLTQDLFKYITPEPFILSEGSIAKKDETRYHFPTKMLMFEFDYIEPYLVKTYLEKYKTTEQQETIFQQYLEERRKLNRIVPNDFEIKYQKCKSETINFIKESKLIYDEKMENERKQEEKIEKEQAKKEQEKEREKERLKEDNEMSVDITFEDLFS